MHDWVKAVSCLAFLILLLFCLTGSLFLIIFRERSIAEVILHIKLRCCVLRSLFESWLRNGVYLNVAMGFI